MKYLYTREFAEKMDALDPLKGFRDQFYFPKHTDGNEAVYLCGNSLGLLPKSAKRAIDEVLNAWRNLGVKDHFDGEKPFTTYHESLGEKMAEVVGAKKEEVVVMNSLTVNLHLMMVSFYRPTKKRHKILILALSFTRKLNDQHAQRTRE